MTITHSNDHQRQAEAMRFPSHPPIWMALMLANIACLRIRSYDLAKQIITVDAGYCLDAPDLLPAGGCGNFLMSPAPELTEQLYWMRA